LPPSLLEAATIVFRPLDRLGGSFAPLEYIRNEFAHQTRKSFKTPELESLVKKLRSKTFQPPQLSMLKGLQPVIDEELDSLGTNRIWNENGDRILRLADVLRLARKGHLNRPIAHCLFMSPPFEGIASLYAGRSGAKTRMPAHFSPKSATMPQR
jgi:hypothetical protein